MLLRRRRRNRRALRRGGALALITLLLPVLVLLAGFAVNFAYMDLIRTETFVAADAATRAGGRTFALTGDLEMVKLRAREAARRNPVAGRPITLADADFVLGRSVRGAQSPGGGGGASGGGDEGSYFNYTDKGASSSLPASGGAASTTPSPERVPTVGAGPPTASTPRAVPARPTPRSAPLPGGGYFPWPRTAQ